jgi:hypothetical protein
MNKLFPCKQLLNLLFIFYVLLSIICCNMHKNVNLLFLKYVNLK